MIIDSLNDILFEVDNFNINRYIKICKKHGYISPERFFVQEIDTIAFRYNPGASWLIFHHSNPLGVHAKESKIIIKDGFLKGRINLSTFSILQWHFGGRQKSKSKNINTSERRDSTLKAHFPKEYSNMLFDNDGFLIQEN